MWASASQIISNISAVQERVNRVSVTITLPGWKGPGLARGVDLGTMWTNFISVSG